MTQRKKLYSSLMFQLRASELAYSKTDTQYTLPANHSKMQRGYVAIELEALAVAWAMEKFHHFLCACHFTCGIQPYWTFREELTIEDGILLKGTPTSYIIEMIQLLHTGYLRLDK